MKYYVYLSNPLEVQKEDGEPNFFISDYADHSEWYKLRELEVDTSYDHSGLYSHCERLLGAMDEDVQKIEKQASERRQQLESLTEALNHSRVENGS
jgi:hypothetical protein